DMSATSNVSTMSAMSTSTLVLARPRTRGVLVAGVVGFAVALALAAQVAVPIPGTPVPLTLQPLLVVLAGLCLGPRAAAASVALYLAAGAAGMPVFAPGGAPGMLRLLGPTGGYLLAMPFAAWTAGRLAGDAARFTSRVGAASAGMLVIYAGGLLQLAVLTGGLARAAVLGVLPFVAVDLVKAVVAAAIAPTRAAPRASA
ncbi:MAG TPA: biotin transporter BioY, partial [Gemmatimonadaceae bacterium]|nr:biotin transporter BioY [Gemmatimonadaceae bacterium]